MWATFPCISLAWACSDQILVFYCITSEVLAELTYGSLLCTSSSGSHETHPACSLSCSKYGSCHTLQPWTRLTQDRIDCWTNTQLAHSHNNHLSAQNCQMYSYVAQQRKDLSMNGHKVVRLNLIQEIWNVFEKEKCPRCFLDFHAPHSHGHKTIGMLQHSTCTLGAALPSGAWSAHNAHSS